MLALELPQQERTVQDEGKEQANARDLKTRYAWEVKDVKGTRSKRSQSTMAKDPTGTVFDLEPQRIRQDWTNPEAFSLVLTEEGGFTAELALHCSIYTTRVQISALSRGWRR